MRKKDLRFVCVKIKHATEFEAAAHALSMATTTKFREFANGQDFTVNVYWCPHGCGAYHWGRRKAGNAQLQAAE